MAAGRMLAKKVSLNKALANLSNDTSRLVFTWTIAHLDCEGRIHGDPEVLRSIVVPRLPHITGEMIGEYIAEWVAGGLVVWYQVGDDLFLEFPKFHENQRGLRPDREAPSFIPTTKKGVPLRTYSGVTPDELRSNSGVLESGASIEGDGSYTTPDLLRSNSGVTPEKVGAMEVKLREGKGSARTREDPPPSDSRAWVVSWYRVFTERTAQTLEPSTEAFVAGAKAWKRGQPETLLASVPAYFVGDYWFTRPRRGTKREWSFSNYLGHLEDVISSMSSNGRPKEPPKLTVKRCPNGHLYAVEDGICMECGWKEKDDGPDFGDP